MPYLFPTPAMTGGMRRPGRRSRCTRDAGRFFYDTMTLVGPGTWEAARAAVDCALTAVDLVVAGERLAYALCRPPGHHATRAGYGGSCYLNNAAVAAEALRAPGTSGWRSSTSTPTTATARQAIFYERADVLYGSVHVDPAAGWFPHVVGYADETGAAQGEGATRNLPLPGGHRATGAGWTRVGDLAEWVAAAGCYALVVSLGVDAAADDPESPLLVTADGYREAGASWADRVCRRSRSRRAATTCPASAAWWRRTSRGTRRRPARLGGWFTLFG